VFAESKEISGDVGMGGGEKFFAGGKLVHEGETEIGFLGGKVDGMEDAREFAAGFPADLAAQAGFVAAGGDIFEAAEKGEKGGFEEVPVLGAAGEEGGELEAVFVEGVHIDDSEVALARGGDIEAKIEIGVAGRESGREGSGKEMFDLDGPIGGRIGMEKAEGIGDGEVFKVKAFDGEIALAKLDGGPRDDGLERGAGVAEVFLIENFWQARPGAAVVEERRAGEGGAGGGIDFFDEALGDGVEEGDAVKGPGGK